MKFIYLYFVLLAVFLISCSSEMPFAPDDDLIVVRAYLYADEPVYDIQLTQTLELGSTDTVATPINNANVVLSKDGIDYALTPSAGDSGYYHYAGEDLHVNPGDVFNIRADYDDQHAFAETTVPQPPSGLTLSMDQVEIETFEFGFGMGRPEEDSTAVISISWDEEDNALFFVTIECLESDPVAIYDNGFAPMGMMRRFVSMPTSRNEYQVSRRTVEYFGEHLIRVYRVNQEYYDLYLSRNQDSRDLNEPLTNVKDGLGIFSAFSSQSATFQVISADD